MTMSTSGAMMAAMNEAARKADQEEFLMHLAVARHWGYLKSSPEDPCQALMTRAIAALELIEEKMPGRLAKPEGYPPVLALRAIAKACRPVIARDEVARGSKPLTFKLRGLKGGALR